MFHCWGLTSCHVIYDDEKQETNLRSRWITSSRSRFLNSMFLTRPKLWQQSQTRSRLRRLMEEITSSSGIYSFTRLLGNGRLDRPKWSQQISLVNTCRRTVSQICLFSYLGVYNLFFTQGRPGFLGIQYIRVFNFRYTVFLCLKLGIKYNVLFLILVFYTRLNIIFGILEGLFQVFWYIQRSLFIVTKRTLVHVEREVGYIWSLNVLCHDHANHRLKKKDFSPGFKYSRSPVTRSLKGNEKQFELQLE